MALPDLELLARLCQPVCDKSLVHGLVQFASRIIGHIQQSDGCDSCVRGFEAECSARGRHQRHSLATRECAHHECDPNHASWGVLSNSESMPLARAGVLAGRPLLEINSEHCALATNSGANSWCNNCSSSCDEPSSPSTTSTGSEAV